MSGIDGISYEDLTTSKRYDTYRFPCLQAVLYFALGASGIYTDFLTPALLAQA